MRTRLSDCLLLMAGLFAGASCALVYTILTTPTPPTSIIQIEGDHHPTIDPQPRAHYDSRPEITL